MYRIKVKNLFRGTYRIGIEDKMKNLFHGTYVPERFDSVGVKTLYPANVPRTMILRSGLYLQIKKAGD